MIRIEIVIHNPHKVIIKHVRENPKEINRTVYDTLIRYGINEATAIDCACYCELATIGESYNEENFDVYING